MNKGNIITICPECRRVMNFSAIGYQSRILEDDIEEVGIECPYCHYWKPVYWLNAELKSMQNPNASRKEKRDYKHKFLKWQKVAKKRYHDRITTINI